MLFSLQLSNIISTMNTAMYPISAEFYRSKCKDVVDITVSMREYFNCGGEINLATFAKQGDPYTKIVNYYKFIDPDKTITIQLPSNLKENTYYYIMTGNKKTRENYSVCYIKQNGKWQETDALEEIETGSTRKNKSKKNADFDEENSQTKSSKNSSNKKANKVTSDSKDGGDMNMLILFLCIGVLGFIMIALSITIHFCRT